MNYPWQRSLIEDVFGVRLFSFYGQTERVILGTECENSSLHHLFPEYGITEIVDAGDLPVTPAGAKGGMVGTGFNNYAMPLIRYQIGDLVERKESEETKSSIGELVESESLDGEASYILHGRAIDAIMTGSGRRVTTRQVDQCFSGLAGIAHYQVLERANGFLVRVEMTHHHANSLCCGGGGGGMWLDGFQWEKARVRLSAWRVREAMLVGADVLAVACPYESPRFEDAAKTIPGAAQLKVRDIAELLTEAMGL